MQRTGSQGSNTRFRVGSSSQGPVFRPGQQSGQPRVQAASQGFQTLQRQIQRSNVQSPRSAPPPSQRNNNAQNTGVVRSCYSCGQSGHYGNRCPRKPANQTLAPVTNQNINRNANNNASTPARQNQVRARVNHVAVEDAQVALDVIIGMILVNDNGAIVLFDSRASHSFIVANFVQKHNLPLSMLKNWMIISSPEGDMHARHVCPKVSILIREGVEFLANLIVFESKGIDVILGMDWLSNHKGMINYAKTAVRLTTSSGKEMEYVAENLVTGKTASNRVVLNQLDAASTMDVRTVAEFLNVFPEELPGMPPDREIKFVIELVPGTAPIFKRPYRMAAN
jgi:hypothetical protein